MLARSLITIAVSGFIIALASCSDRRPEVAQAKADFSRLYPSAEVVSVRVSENEVVARTYAIIYRQPGQSQRKMLEVQYVKNHDGVYQLAPAPPSELPP
jgi:hypothetical protein